jgi:predicted dehydrogenase
MGAREARRLIRDFGVKGFKFHPSMQGFFPNDRSAHITEKVDRKTGWQFICLEEDWTRGYLQEIQDFMECVAIGRQPRADLALAYETTKINYAGYWSAEEGRRIAL